MPLYSADLFQEFGWAFTSQNKSLAYSLEDYQQNGKYCKSGLAYQAGKNTAKCTEVEDVYQGTDGGPLPAPYKCNPKNPHKKCKLAFTI